ncbi:MAG: 2-amino-4-hydroxy-6-hydroxymethyldihydropteridine diphosphokinase [Gemmatimonadaceae bacterium]|nr:2-amino-4-hydroxy-6-hydroxymethyldihydropteridine diphosphokinase [Gemmatimonadaceae bacterium]
MRTDGAREATRRYVAYVALGSNLGDRAAQLDRARSAMSLLPMTELIATSAIEETSPLGTMAQCPYLNQMAALRTRMHPFALLASLQRIERALGRSRSTRWAARTIDLDIVRAGGMRIDSPTLVLPHPAIGTRSFWQREIGELDRLMAA